MAKSRAGSKWPTSRPRKRVVHSETHARRGGAQSRADWSPITHSWGFSRIISARRLTPALRWPEICWARSEIHVQNAYYSFDRNLIVDKELQRLSGNMPKVARKSVTVWKIPEDINREICKRLFWKGLLSCFKSSVNLGVRIKSKGVTSGSFWKSWKVAVCYLMP